MINVFPGYDFIGEKNMFRGEDVGFGGYVYANPGAYYRAVCFDVASMHPHSAIAMNCFGEYTKRFEEIVEARVAIKHKDFDKAGKMIDGKLAPYLGNPAEAKDVASALKTVVNSIYGLSSASFKNAFRDERNINNIVALRGALFMVTLRDELQARGQTVIHIKTDSIKVENPSRDISDFIIEFGKKYGYDFEIEHVFDKICLTNRAVYIGKLSKDDPDDPGKWTATGAQFAQPYVFKTLFSHDNLEFGDYCETKSVSSPAALYLDRNENLPEGEHNYEFVGRTGSFVPVLPGCNGGLLLRYDGTKYSQASGTTGYRWLESEMVKSLGLEDKIDTRYHKKLVDDALAEIGKFCDAEAFINDDPPEDVPPWCGDECNNCSKCNTCTELPF